MAGTRTRARACEGKQRNTSVAAAAAQLATLVRKRGVDPERYRIYRCDSRGGCGYWHIGHKPPGRQKGRRS